MLPSKEQLTQHLGHDDFFLWEYYGEGILCKIQAWIFRSRIKVIRRFLKQLQKSPRTFLDIGCGSMFISYSLVSNDTDEYIGLDTMPTTRLKKYRDTMREVGIERIEVVRSSAESLPFRKEIFAFVLSLDVLEHLNKPRESVMEIYRVVRNRGFVAISLPLENMFQKASRIGFIIMKLMGDKRAKRIPITKTPEYHYVGDIKSYNCLTKVIKNIFYPMLIRYTPIGLHKLININAVHILQKR
jgi:ubiquinone/menaquinone biosynthesis C-methylase UbiE